jgi:hypothetical protein
MVKELPLMNFERLLSLSAAHIYWLDNNNVYHGCNEKQARAAGLSSRFDIVGKKNGDLLWNKNNPDNGVRSGQKTLNFRMSFCPDLTLFFLFKTIGVSP